MKYSEKLKDPRWQKKRLEIMERDGWECRICGDSQSTLVIHHSKYTGQPWDAENEYLKTLCESCHEAEHRDLQGFKERLNELMVGMDSDCFQSLICIILALKKSSGFPVNIGLNIIKMYVEKDFNLEAIFNFIKSEGK